MVGCSGLNVGVELIVATTAFIGLEPGTVSVELDGWVGVNILALAKIVLCDAVDACNMKVGRVFEMTVGFGNVVEGWRKVFAVFAPGRVELDEPHALVGGASEVAGGQRLDGWIEGGEWSRHDTSCDHEQCRDGADPSHCEWHVDEVMRCGCRWQMMCI